MYFMLYELRAGFVSKQPTLSEDSFSDQLQLSDPLFRETCKDSITVVKAFWPGFMAFNDGDWSWGLTFKHLSMCPKTIMSVFVELEEILAHWITDLMHDSVLLWNHGHLLILFHKSVWHLHNYGQMFCCCLQSVLVGAGRSWREEAQERSLGELHLIFVYSDV